MEPARGGATRAFSGRWPSHVVYSRSTPQTLDLAPPPLPLCSRVPRVFAVNNAIPRSAGQRRHFPRHIRAICRFDAIFLSIISPRSLVTWRPQLGCRVSRWRQGRARASFLQRSAIVCVRQNHRKTNLEIAHLFFFFLSPFESVHAGI